MNSKFISESHSLEKKMKIKSEVPLIVILSWVSLHDFSGKEIYIVTFGLKKYIMLENGFDISFSVL